MIVLRNYLFVPILIFNCFAYSQTKHPSAFLDYSDSVIYAHPIEKVHLHLDKPYYSAGQTIWLKAYVVDGRNKPSMLSKILYIDLIDESNRLYKSLKLPLAAGLASGDFFLSDTLEEGNYRLRAYTLWTRNFGKEDFYNRVVQIGNLLRTDVSAHVSYTYRQNGNFDEAEATISYATVDGAPLQNLKINYDIKFNNGSVQSSNATTGVDGKVKIMIVGKDTTSKSGIIRTSFLRNGQMVNKNFAFKSLTSKINIHFFPEGGYLVDSIRSKVAFKAIGANGLGIPISGFVVNEQNTKVAEFKSEHAGLGSFMLSPFNNQTYTAVINLPEGEMRVALPKALPQGYVLSIIGEDTESLLIRITANKVNLSNKAVSLVVQTNVGQQLFHYLITKRFIDVSFQKSDLPTGITLFTLLDENHLPVAERLRFIQNRDELIIDFQKKEKDPKEPDKVSLEIVATDKNQLPITGSFSISVTDLSRVPVNDEDENSILSDLLLSSELKGYIEKPNYYFINPNPDKDRQLDNVMLTHGWRRFSWKNVYYGFKGPKIIFPIEKDLQISGSVFLRGKPVVGGRVTALSPTTGFYMDTITNTQGQFNFNNLVFSDSTKFIIQARQTKDRMNTTIKLDSTPDEKIGSYEFTGEINENVNTQMANFLNVSKKEVEELIALGLVSRSHLLKEVVVTSTRKDNVINSSRLSKNAADFSFRGEELEGENLGNALRGKVPGLIVDLSGNTAIMQRNLSSANVPLMQLFVDGVNWGSVLTDINVSEIATVEILKGGASAALYGDKGAGGVIIVTTKVFGDQRPVNYESTSGLISFISKGYSITKEFFNPENSTGYPKTGGNLRTTLYWNPDVFIDNGKVGTINFFNTANPGTYRIVIEGLDHKGQLGRATFNTVIN